MSNFICHVNKNRSYYWAERENYKNIFYVKPIFYSEKNHYFIDVMRVVSLYIVQIYYTI